ncbi:MAG: cyclase family protein [Anaerolineae bacterium]
MTISEVMPVWPGDPRVEIEPVARMDKGAGFNTSRLHLSSHTGTHVDAPFHFEQQGVTVDKLPLELLMGPAFVAEVDRLESKAIGVYDLASVPVPKGTARLLIKTENSYYWEDREPEFQRNFIHLNHRAARWLVGGGIKLVGVDYLSVDAFQSKEHRVHHMLLSAGVVIVEGLDLSRVPAGPCQLVCLPLKIKDGDGAPARVLVIRD